MTVDQLIAVLRSLTPEERARPIAFDSGVCEIESVEMNDGKGVGLPPFVEVSSAYWGDTTKERIRRC
ncbi:MAG TPA: hypothetical protein VHM19_23250 [Polyangiales bacterium]|jgi:hypothetical protein|nr:hypothetical protein [Polyangiales bacterium]